MVDKTGMAGNRVELDTRLYEKNLTLLRSNPKYWKDADRIDNASLPENAWVQTSQTGDPVIVLEKDGHPYPLDSLHNPVKSARRWVESLDLENRLHVYVVGLGSGYIVDALREKVLDYIALVSLDISLFKLLLYVRDIEEWILDDRVRFFLDLREVDLLNSLNQDRNFIDRVVSRPLIVEYPPIKNIYPKKSQQVKGLIRDNLFNARVCLVTNIGIGAIQIRNSLLNFPYLMKTPGMEVWYDWLKGIPILCIAPGPSLRDSIEFVRQAKDYALLISVDTAVPVLQLNGIDPDVVVGLDFSRENAQHYERMVMDRLVNSLLVAAADVYETILPMWKGALSVIYMTHLFQSFFVNKIGLFKGLSTAHTAFMFSLFSGADPIILVGLDLSYPELSSSHVPEAVNKVNLKLIKDKSGTEVLAKVGKEGVKYVWARRVEGVDGKDVVTEDIFVGYLRDFERVIDVAPIQIWDVKPKGAKIKGTRHMSMSMALDEIKKMDLKGRIAQKREEMKIRSMTCNVLFDRIGFEAYWRGLIGNMREFKDLVESEFAYLEKMRESLRDREDLSFEEMRQVNESIDRIFDEKYKDIMNLVQNFSAAVMVMIRKFFTLKKEIPARERLDTILAFFEALIGGCEDVISLLEEVDQRYRAEGLIR